MTEILAHPLDLPISSTGEMVFLCKQGNDSQLAAAAVRKALKERDGAASQRKIRDVRGGLRAWTKHVDPDFPVY